MYIYNTGHPIPMLLTILSCKTAGLNLRDLPFFGTPCDYYTLTLSLCVDEGMLSHKLTLYSIAIRKGLKPKPEQHLA